eukprot:CAMPEP_0174236152 /NCGR_PEP_ID=MMETSP0417-20130205/5371_1 /TAXON_ID=242541 /ORGANISM="Mayorella sp, Strain BSH-02190019" /LENGTH=327 /DNA_ID=CAMNT_0015314749 /DNA_START=39 /DNA_END=1022 /DNA_ORIENTATION=+
MSSSDASIRKRKVIIDCDPGIDDALALMLAFASPHLDIVGITIVYGNHPDPQQLARNACALCQLAQQSHIPVFVGASRPLVREYTGHTGMLFHGPTGTGHLPEADIATADKKQPEIDKTAAEFIASAARADPGQIVLITLGPTTNAALALSLEPRLPTLLHGLVVMGGAYTTSGNASPVSEANVKNDPEAASLLLAAPWTRPVTLIGLDVTRQTKLTPAFFDSLRQNQCVQHLKALKRFYFERFETIGVQGGCPVHDSSAVMAVIDPTLFECEDVLVRVECRGEFTSGMTVADWKHHFEGAPNARVALHVDSARLLSTAATLLNRLP